MESPPPPAGVLTLRATFRTALAPLLLSFAVGAACYFVLGATTGFFFGMVAAVALLTPLLTVAQTDRARQLVTTAAVIDGVAAACLFAVSDPAVSVIDWLKAYALLAAWGAALWGITSLLTRLRVEPTLASALTVAIALAWLAWPIWLSPSLAGRETLVAWLVAPHPLLALDGALRHLGPAWTERHYMYTHLSVLNQDVFYSLPRGVIGAALFHAAVGTLCLLPYLRLRRGRRTRHDAVAPENDRREHLG